ncbi:Anaerobic dimethyl sulfoxide reductase chain C, anchor subunit [hydrothermal vent metagenome]|uniref:Anaerobic dimethyl sulfoxide reductase chain C, anchor subunit n=1 Tax=hydrothermal vent metagenome TaxID=652676 RepID=A0A3B1AC37_9ZZZZ
MQPAFSVIFLTTLIGAGQGLFLALITGQSYSALKLLPSQDSTDFYGMGAVIVLILLIGGLIASFFHLGRPERAWRSAAMWRTSWLSREVIALPSMMGLVFIYGVMQFMGWDTVLFTSADGANLQLTMIVGIVGALATFALFLCTGMIYACLKFLQEWHSPLTVINYTLLGTASGFILATAFANHNAPELMRFFGIWAIIITIAAFITRTASLVRNSRIKAKSTMQTALGVRHSKIQQKAMGFMGGSVNTRDFFNHVSKVMMKNMKWTFIVLAFIVPLITLWYGMDQANSSWLLAAFIIQYVGLIAERWFFFAQANHPQNLYYQTI